ncbi:MAG: MEDS domain-containing protein [Armatimonadetes bacterium]|nr:MEDS domain-containing protein [Armatimonadota bacterium]
MKVGDRVHTEIALPGIPAGRRGVITEVGRLFLVVAFEDGRHGYYARRQLALAALPPGGEECSTGELIPLGVADASVPRGSHLCLLPSNRNVAVNVIARYAAAGLSCRESVLCILPDKWQRRFLRTLSLLRVESEAALRRGLLAIVSPSEVYQPPSTFVVRDQLERTATAVSRALDSSPGGLRLFGCPGETHTAEGWWEYEERIAPILRAFGATALCVYEQDGLTADVEQKATLLHTHVLRDGRLTVGGSRIL